MNATTRYASICGFFSLCFLLQIVSMWSNYHCNAFTQPSQQQLVRTTRHTQLLGQRQQHTGITNRRNRFWGSIGQIRPAQESVLSQHQQRRSSADSVGVAVYSGPSILDRPTTITRESSTVKEGRRQRQQEQHVDDRQQKYDETWEVRLYNDGLNTREHVSRSLVHVTGLSEYQAYQTMMQAHHNGVAVVGQYFYEIAEMFHDALKLEGIICDIIPVE